MGGKYKIFRLSGLVIDTSLPISSVSPSLKSHSSSNTSHFFVLFYSLPLLVSIALFLPWSVA